MPLDVAVSAVLDAPRAQVAAWTADPENDTTWYRAIREVRWITPPPLAVGSRVARVAVFLGRRLAYTYVVDAWVPGERLELSAVDGPFPMRTIYEWADAGAGRTRMTIRNVGGPTGFMAPLTPLMAWQVRRALAADLAHLAAVLPR